METNAEKEILEHKKRLFSEYVDRSAKLLKTSKPHVKFWPHYDDHFPDGERAHCHSYERLICIAEPELKIMDEDEIKTTASHEVTHILHPDHNYHFYNTQRETERGLWSPPHGTMGALPEDYVPEIQKKDKRKQRPVKYKCNYHVCGKKAKTSKCKHCKHYFCKNHIEARTPKDKFELELDEHNSHPCFRVYDYLKRKKEKEHEAYMKTLDILQGKLKPTYKTMNIKIKKDELFKGTFTEDQYEEEFDEEGEIEDSSEEKVGFFDRLKCKFGFHKWEKLGGLSNVGGGQFRQKYICKRCGLTEDIIT